MLLLIYTELNYQITNNPKEQKRKRKQLVTSASDKLMNNTMSSEVDLKQVMPFILMFRSYSRRLISRMYIPGQAEDPHGVPAVPPHISVAER